MTVVAHPPRGYYAGALPPHLYPDDVLTFGPARPRPPRGSRWSRGAPWLAAGAALVLTVGALVLASASDPPVAAPPPVTEADAGYQPLPGVPLTGPAEEAVSAVTVATAPVDAADPYAVWLLLKPDDAPDLSADDALARALLGCGQQWPAGTTDAALQQAYVGSGRIRCPEG